MQPGQRQKDGDTKRWLLAELRGFNNQPWSWWAFPLAFPAFGLLLFVLSGELSLTGAVLVGFQVVGIMLLLVAVIGAVGFVCHLIEQRRKP